MPIETLLCAQHGLSVSCLLTLRSHSLRQTVKQSRTKQSTTVAQCVDPIYVCEREDVDYILHAGVTDCNPSPDGLQYVGTTAVTMNGRICQAWASQFPHSYGYNQDSLFPADGSVTAADNHCRNPDNVWMDSVATQWILLCHGKDATCLFAVSYSATSREPL